MGKQSYTVKELADLSGVSVRMLHYYDEIGLLVPGRDKSGYRVYGQEQVVRLQSILAMRFCALPLDEMHAAWIQMHWADGTYSAEAHRGLAQGYLADDRFKAYYDSAAGEGATEFLVKALLANL